LITVATHMPVWHRRRNGGFDVVTGEDDVKARHLRRDPRASIVLFESDPPYRRIEVRAERCSVDPARTGRLRAWDFADDL
jgi:hypothetical protein